MTIPETRFSSSSVGSANNTELQINKIHSCQLFLQWLIGIPEHRHEIKETIKYAQSGEEETELLSVRLLACEQALCSQAIRLHVHME